MSAITPQMSSMKAVEAWVSIINADVGGMVRTAYKATRPTFRGTAILRDMTASAGGILPLQFPEPALTVSSSIDFTQGPVVASTSVYHLALNGPGFFPVVPPSGFNPQLYTRDGEFTLQPSANGYCLVNPQGLRLYLPSVGALAEVPTSDPAQFDAYGLVAGRRIEIVVPPSPNAQLQFSAYGSTAFEQAAPFVPLPISPLDPANRPKFTNGITALQGQSLEASNADMNTLIPELALSQKMFVAISKIMSAHLQNLETIFEQLR